MDEQAEEQVLGAEVVLVAALGLFPAKVRHDAGRLGEAHHPVTSQGRTGGGAVLS